MNVLKLFFFLALFLCVCSSLRLRNKMRSLRPAFDKYRAKPKITFGDEAVPHSIPYLAAIKVWRSLNWCSGALIKDDMVITAAKCVNVADIHVYMTVVLGAHRVNEYESTQQTLKVDHCWAHPKNPAYDVGLIHLMRRAVLNEYVDIIPLAPLAKPADAPNYAGSLLQVSGWGNTEYFEPSSVLLYVVLMGITNDDCAKFFPSAHYYGFMLCAATSEGKSPCHGDNGGPLVDVESGLLIGIAWHGDDTKDCDQGSAVWFTRISYPVIRNWINQWLVFKW